MIEGGLDPNYVLDEMQTYEIQPLIDSLYIKHKEPWEMTRFIGYITALVNSTQKLKTTDIIKFPWDEKEEEATADTSISNSEIERLRNCAEQYINNMK